MSKKMIGVFSENKEARKKMICITVGIQRVKDIRRDDRDLGLKGAVEFIEAWCEDNSTGVWSQDSHIHYYFEDETDAMAFKLMWA